MIGERSAGRQMLIIAGGILLAIALLVGIGLLVGVFVAQDAETDFAQQQHLLTASDAQARKDIRNIILMLGGFAIATIGAIAVARKSKAW